MIVKGILYVACAVAFICTCIGLLGWWCWTEYVKIVKADDK